MTSQNWKLYCKYSKWERPLMRIQLSFEKLVDSLSLSHLQFSVNDLKVN
jgi:hypothetical protein